jgi:hypothetical protein
LIRPEVRGESCPDISHDPGLDTMIQEVVHPDEVTIDPGSGGDERCRLHGRIVDR